MDIDELIAAGRSLALPCLVLSAAHAEDTIIGYWGTGEKSDNAPGQLWLTVDVSWLYQHGFPIDGYLSLYSDVERVDFAVVHTPRERLPVIEGGIPLTGKEEMSLPQEEAIIALRYSSDELQESPSRDAVEAYRKIQLETAFAGWAILGGWRMSWPDDDDYPEDPGYWQVDRRLVLRTSHNAEPWVEVWMLNDGRIEAIARRT